MLVYVSNSSEQYVYFDNLQVGRVNGNLLEENHYYSFGLRIAAISSRRFTDGFQGQARNDYLYNGKERMDGEADPGWLEYGFRYYDPQIGRFHQIDPLSDDLEAFSPYHYAYNDPIMLIDWMGLAGFTPDFLARAADVIGAATAPTLQEVVVTAARKAGSSGFSVLQMAEHSLDIYVATQIGNPKDFIRRATLSSKGFINALASNQLMGAGRVNVNDIPNISAADRESIRTGQVIGDAASVLAGLAWFGLAGSAEVASLGFATPAALQFGALGLSAITQGVGNMLKFAAETGPSSSRSSDLKPKQAGNTENSFAGKEIFKTTTRIGKDGKAVGIVFKDGSKVDISRSRVKEWVPNNHPNAPDGALQRVRFKNPIPGSKGYKRTPTQTEINFLKDL